MAHSTGLFSDETCMPCRTLVACLALCPFSSASISRVAPLSPHSTELLIARLRPAFCFVNISEWSHRSNVILNSSSCFKGAPRDTCSRCIASGCVLLWLGVSTIPPDLPLHAPVVVPTQHTCAHAHTHTHTHTHPHKCWEPRNKNKSRKAVKETPQELQSSPRRLSVC